MRQITFLKAALKYVVARAYRGFPRYDGAPTLGATLANDIRFLKEVWSHWN